MLVLACGIEIYCRLAHTHRGLCYLSAETHTTHRSVLLIVNQQYNTQTHTPINICCRISYREVVSGASDMWPWCGYFHRRERELANEGQRPCAYFLRHAYWIGVYALWYIVHVNMQDETHSIWWCKKRISYATCNVITAHFRVYRMHAQLLWCEHARSPVANEKFIKPHAAAADTRSLTEINRTKLTVGYCSPRCTQHTIDIANPLAPAKATTHHL